MKYKDKELVEMTPEKWDGKTREMLVWDTEKYAPVINTIVSYTTNGQWLNTIGDESNHCAEIPKELTVDELKAQIERLKEDTKNLSDGWNAEIEANNELKKENAALKEKIKSLCVERDKMAKSVSADLLVELTERCIGAKPFDDLQDELHKIAEFAQNAILEYKSEKKLRRMTYKELEDWLIQCNGLLRIGNKTYNNIYFDCGDRNKEVRDGIEICGHKEHTWHEPLINEYLDYKSEDKSENTQRRMSYRRFAEYLSH